MITDWTLLLTELSLGILAPKINSKLLSTKTFSKLFNSVFLLFLLIISSPMFVMGSAFPQLHILVHNVQPAWHALFSSSRPFPVQKKLYLITQDNETNHTFLL